MFNAKEWLRKDKLAIQMYIDIHNHILQSSLCELDKNIELASLNHVHTAYELDDKLRKFAAIGARLGVKFTIL